MRPCGEVPAVPSNLPEPDVGAPCVSVFLLALGNLRWMVCDPKARSCLQVSHSARAQLVDWMKGGWGPVI